jgi:hypothetical protein
VPLLIAGPTLIREVQRRTAGVLTNEQLMMLVAGVGALVVLAVVGRRTFQNNTSMPSSRTYDAARPSPTPQTPRFEPIVTGKVLLAGLVLGVLFALGVFVLLMYM